MGTSVKVSYVEKLQQEIRTTCSSLEKLGYDSLVIVSSCQGHVEMGSARGRRFLERKLNFIGEFLQFCKGSSLYRSRDAKTEKFYVAEPLKSNGTDMNVFNLQKPNVLKSQKSLNMLHAADRKQSIAASTTYRHNPPIVVIKPKQAAGQAAETDSNTSDKDSEVERSDYEPDNGPMRLKIKPPEPVKGAVLPKGGIVVITRDEIQKKGSEMMRANQKPFVEKVSPWSVNPARKRKAPVTQKVTDISPVKSFNCDQCDKRYKRKDDLIIHQRKHSGELPFCCQTCGKRFISPNCLRSHISVHLDATPFGCMECGQLFARQSYLTRHMKTVHSNVYSRVCETCGRSFKDSQGLYNHRLIHSQKNFACETCGKRFLRQTALNSHKLIHTGVKPYACTICWAEFRMKKNLTTHQWRKHPLV